MNNSYWLLSEVPHKNIAHPHQFPEDGSDQPLPEVLVHYGYPDYPDGQLRTTVGDYAQILKLMINEGKVNGSPFIKKETILMNAKNGFICQLQKVIN